MKHHFTDIHHHLLYGMDDGPRTPKEMYAMLRRAAEQSISRIVVTPHVTPGVRRFRKKQYHRALERARRYCKVKGLNIRLYEGAELLFTEHTPRLLREQRVPSMNGGDHVLVEFSPDVRYERMCDALEQLISTGIVPIVAHVERYRCLVMRPRRAVSLHAERGVLFQANCRAVLGECGFFARHFLKKMLGKRMIDAVATDAHNVANRSAEMKKAWKLLDKTYGTKYATRLTNGSVLTR